MKERSITNRYCKIVSLILNILLTGAAFCNFFTRYILFKPVFINTITGENLALDFKIFYIDFYVFFILFTVFLFAIVLVKNFWSSLISLVITIVSANLCLYTVYELFTIKVFIFSAWILTVAIRFRPKRSIPIMIFGMLSFIMCQFYPSFIGVVSQAHNLTVENFNDFYGIVCVFICIAFFACIYRSAIYKWEECNNTKNHLNMIMSQMTVLNRKLQDFAKNNSKEAVEEERLRITRDMHDSCGYVFVNIVSLMEACLSGREMEWERTRGTFETVRDLASHGLKETRETLRTIRDIQSRTTVDLKALNEIRDIFRTVTGIEVDLDRGNIKNDYGRTINKILIRTMQEGLTNAVRHGFATYVAVYFWEENDYVLMTVKDNGIGSKQVVKGIGLAGMEERLQEVGGTLTTGLNVEGGFKLEIKIPIMKEVMGEYGKTETIAG